MPGSKLLRNFFALSVLAAFPGMLQATNPLILFPTSVALTCAKGVANCAASVSVAVSDASGPDYFLVNPASVPYWLQVSLMNGQATTTPLNMVFTPSAAWINLSVGTYTASVSITGGAITAATVPVTRNGFAVGDQAGDVHLDRFSSKPRSPARRCPSRAPGSDLAGLSRVGNS